MYDIANKLWLLLNTNFSNLDESVQEEVYKKVHSLVYGVAIYMLKDHAAAEDVVQEVFLKLIYNPPVASNEQKLTAWIKVVTRNHILDILKRNKKNRYEEDVETVYIHMESNDQTVGEEVEAKILKEHIEESLLQLKPDHRLIIELRWKKGMSYREIAVLLDVTEQVIKQKLYRARESLRRRLREKWRIDDE